MDELDVEPLGTSDSSEEPLDKSHWRWLRYFVAGFLLILAGTVAWDLVEPAEAWAALGLLAAAVVFFVLGPADVRDFVSRITEVGPVKLAEKLAKRASDQTVGAEEDSSREIGSSVLDLRMELESKMTYLAKHVLGTDGGGSVISGNANFLTIGSLRKDSLLTQEQAETAALILGWNGREASSKDGDFVVAASKFVNGFRITVFANLVRRECARKGWSVSDQLSDRYRDFRITDKESGSELVVTPVLATKANSDLLDGVFERVTRDHGDRSVVVVPDISKSPDPNEKRQLRFTEFMSELEAGNLTG